MNHTESLINKAKELKSRNVQYDFAADDICEYHKIMFLSGNMDARKEFNIQNGLKEFSRPEKSYWRVYEILDEIYN